MVVVTELLTLLNTLSPLAVIALLAVIIYLLVKGKQEVSGKVSTISDNHLHDLPAMAETLQRIEVSLSENFAYIKAKLNGGNRG